jgi:tRNA(Ile)-lysidine synthase
MLLVRKKVLNFIKEHGLFAPGDRVIVGFSGGADSMALLDILANLPEFPLQLVPAHLNHLLRSDESDSDEIFVRRVAEKHALPLEITRIDVASLALEKGLSLEEAGREVRRSFFLKIAEKQSAFTVALGHHRDDQAETVLMRLVRGAAGSGLQGMSPKSPGSIFVRPLLCLNRSEIEAYLSKGRLEFREDSSNYDTRFLRNRIRHELLPLLRSYNPVISECLNQTAEVFAADEELLESVVGAAYPGIVSNGNGEIRINLEKVRHEPQALRKRLYRRVLSAVKGDLKRISSKHLADMDSLAIAEKGGGKLSLPSGVLVIKEYNSMVITGVPEEPAGENREISVDSCGSYELAPDKILLVERVDSPPTGWEGTGKDAIFVEMEQLPFPWTIRYFREGDRFTPFGMSGRKKIKDLFIDKKIPLESRKNIPLFVCKGEIFWAGGVQQAESTRIIGSPGGLLRLRMICSASSGRH